MAATIAPGGRTGAVALELARRGLVGLRRMPSAFIPALAMPVFQTIAFSGAFYAITQLPIFPTKQPLNWYMPMSATMGASFAGLGVSFSAVRDLESGFYDRLLMAPCPRRSLVIGPLLGAMVRAAVVMLLTFLVGLAGGARLQDGLGVLTLLAAAEGVAVVSGLFGLGLAYRLRHNAAVSIVQSMIFIVMFLSIAQVPLTVMRGWLHGVARVNPATNVLRLAREGFLGDVTWANTWPGLLALVAGTAAGALFAQRGLVRLDHR